MSTIVESPVKPEARIPDLLREHPKLRAVLDRYGLKGCGGPLGPNETLRYFARAHGIREDLLFAELEDAYLAREAPAAPAPPVKFEPSVADTIYRRFFKAGIAIVLSAGALWGAMLLLQIGFSQSFFAVSIHDVNAHGHAQIFGWLGLFVMGFAYQAFPRFKHTTLAYPSLAVASFWLMVAGIAVRVVAEPLVGNGPMFLWAGIAAGAMELIAIAAFLVVMGTTFRRSGKPLETYDFFVIAALGFFALQGIGDLALFVGTSTATTTEALVATVANWQPVLRDLQIHGFALLMVLGVSQRVLPGMYGYAKVEDRTARRTLAIVLAAVAGEIACWLWFRASNHTSIAAALGLWGSTILLAAAVLGIVRQLGVLGKCPEPDRSTKFFRAAFAWLLLSLVLLVAMPLYLRVVGVPFSHAYAGSVRHAITVGFLSLMILGVAAKVVPTLCGVDARTLPNLMVPFLLVNLGCGMRVGFQILTDFVPTFAFPVAGVSGVLEVTGIGIWGIGLWRLMSARARADREEASLPVLASSVAREITAQDRVGPLVDSDPRLLDVFLRAGFEPLRSPFFRRTMAQQVTVGTACAMHGIDAAALLRELNSVRRSEVALEPARAATCIDPSLTVAEVLKHFPGTAPVFARHRIDACCGGTKSITTVCEKHAIPLDELLHELEAATLEQVTLTAETNGKEHRA